MRLNIEVRTTDIVASCNVCGDFLSVPNKGLGRAVLAAWKTRHQHIEDDA